jgi:stress response protein YsnF
MTRELMMREDNAQVVVPLFEEKVSIGKRQIVTGRARIAIVTSEREELVDELLRREHVEIERMPVGRFVDHAPEVRQEGDTLIVPVMEEVLVVERRLLLKEEVRVRRVQEAERHQERVKVRRQEVVLTRHPVTTQVAAGDPAAEIEKQTFRKEK